MKKKKKGFLLDHQILLPAIYTDQMNWILLNKNQIDQGKEVLYEAANPMNGDRYLKLMNHRIKFVFVF